MRNDISNYFFPGGASSFDFRLPTKIIFGEGTLGRLGSEIKQLHGSRALIVTSAGMPGRQPMKVIISCLDQAGINYKVFSSITPDPSMDDVNGCLEFINKIKPDFIVGLGGGSAMDVAKKLAMEIAVPKIMIPTTAGSGSEVTQNSVIKVDGRKKTFSDLKLAADAAIIDPDLLITLPAAPMVCSALDAMAHAVESFGARKGNSLARALALEAYLLVKNNIRLALSGEAEGRRNIAAASLLAGIALTTTGTTLGHALSYPLSNQGMPHGQALALVLPYLLEINRFDAGYAGELRAFRRRYCHIPQTTWDIPQMSGEVIADKRHLANNPREITLQEIADVYSAIRAEGSDTGHGSKSRMV